MHFRFGFKITFRVVFTAKAALSFPILSWTKEEHTCSSKCDQHVLLLLQRQHVWFLAISCVFATKTLSIAHNLHFTWCVHTFLINSCIVASCIIPFSDWDDKVISKQRDGHKSNTFVLCVLITVTQINYRHRPVPVLVRSRWYMWQRTQAPPCRPSWHLDPRTQAPTAEWLGFPEKAWKLHNTCFSAFSPWWILSQNFWQRHLPESEWIQFQGVWVPKVPAWKPFHLEARLFVDTISRGQKFLLVFVHLQRREKYLYRKKGVRGVSKPRCVDGTHEYPNEPILTKFFSRIKNTLMSFK